MPRGPMRELGAVAVLPDRDLARRCATPESPFTTVFEFPEYPAGEVLERRVRQFGPDVLLVDVSSDLTRSSELIRAFKLSRRSSGVVAVSTRNDAELILTSLRAGATEFLCPPFDAAIAEAAAERIRGACEVQGRSRGHSVVFWPAKPGAGASLLASHSAMALTRGAATVLLADLDEALGPSAILGANCRRIESPAWPHVIFEYGNVDLISLSAGRRDQSTADFIHRLLEHAASSYDWCVLDIPLLRPEALPAMVGCDRNFTVCTPELPSVHLAYRALQFLHRNPHGDAPIQVLLNRERKRAPITRADVQTILGNPVHAGFPEDRNAAERAHPGRAPMTEESLLARSIADFVRRLDPVAPPN